MVAGSCHESQGNLPHRVLTMTVGTKSVLFGYHAFWLHPFFVAAGWWKLYGTPLDPRLWFAFFLHDVGYVGSPNMDGVRRTTTTPLLVPRSCVFCLNSDCRVVSTVSLSQSHTVQYLLCSTLKTWLCGQTRLYILPSVVAKGAVFPEW